MERKNTVRRHRCQLGVVVQAYNPNILEMETRDQEFNTNLGHIKTKQQKILKRGQSAAGVEMALWAIDLAVQE